MPGAAVRIDGGLARKSGGAFSDANGKDCCCSNCFAEVLCSDDSPTGYYALKDSFDTTKVYKNEDGECVKYVSADPCPPEGATERTEAPGDVYDNCTACAGWLQAYNCATSAPLTFGGHTYWIEADSVDPSKVYKMGDLCINFPDPAQDTPDDTGRLDTITPTAAGCDECLYCLDQPDTVSVGADLYKNPLSRRCHDAFPVEPDGTFDGTLTRTVDPCVWRASAASTVDPFCPEFYICSIARGPTSGAIASLTFTCHPSFDILWTGHNSGGASAGILGTYTREGSSVLAGPATITVS